MLQRSDLSRLKIEIYGFQKSANSSQIDRKEKQNFEIENIFFFLLEKVSKWKLYKTARKRGIYAEIKKQNQAQVRPLSLSLSISLSFISLLLPTSAKSYQPYSFFDKHMHFILLSLSSSSTLSNARKHTHTR